MKEQIVFILFLSVLSFAPQIGIAQNIYEKVKEVNKKLPIVNDEGSIIESVIIENGYVVQHASKLSIYNSDGNISLRSYGESFLEQARNESVRAMYEDILSAGMGVKQVMFFKDENKTDTITFEVSDLKRMLAFPTSAYWQLLNELRGARKGLPMATDDGLTCIAYETPHYEFIYVFEAEENVYQIDLLQKNLNKNKFKVLSELATGKSDLFEMAKICANAGFGLGMKYIGKSSGKSAEMIMSYDELRVCFE